MLFDSWPTRSIIVGTRIRSSRQFCLSLSRSSRRTQSFAQVASGPSSRVALRIDSSARFFAAITSSLYCWTSSLASGEIFARICLPVRSISKDTSACIRRYRASKGPCTINRSAASSAFRMLANHGIVRVDGLASSSGSSSKSLASTTIAS